MLDQVIERLGKMSRQGAAYDHMGRHGWSNPIRQDTGPILQVLAAARQPKQVLEIGTAHGESMCNLAKGIPTAVFTGIEWLPELAEEAQANLNEAKVKARVLCGDAMQIIPTLDRAFELVFLDANKDGYLEQFLMLQTYHLLNKNCLVIADNVIDRQMECQNFLDHMKKYPHSILPTECGLLIAMV